MKTIEQLGKLFGKTVLLRADFNVPMKGKKIVDNYKIKKTLATLNFLVERGAKVVITSHLGRPEGVESALSLKPIATELSKFLQKSVVLLPITDLAKTKKQIEKLGLGQIALLENIRFAKGERENSLKFTNELANLADIFVLDGFGVLHRQSPSVTGVAKYLPAYAGLLLEAELAGLNQVMKKPKRPLVLVLGGIKTETKIGVLKNFLSRADYILLGGGIFNTYLWAKGYKVGVSTINKKFKKEVLDYVPKKKVILPVDVIVGTKAGKLAKAMPLKTLQVKKELGMFDIGPQTIKLFSRYIKKAKTIVWNGALGYFEQSPYQYGTYSIARVIASQSKRKAYGVAGGGETIAVLEKLKVLSDIDLPSTGGGSMLEYLSGKKLPGLEALK